MKVIFQNTGMIESGEIELNGLTVVAGENDTGKSTIGKILFAIIKAFHSTEKKGPTSSEFEIDKIIEKYFTNIKMKIGEKDPVIEDIIEPLFKEIKNDSLKLTESNESDMVYENQLKIISEKIEQIASTINQSFGVGLDLDSFLNEITDLNIKLKESKDIFKKAFESYMYSFFGTDIANKFSIDREYAVSGYEKSKTIFEVTGSYESTHAQLTGTLLLNDVTYIESPIPLDIVDTIRISKTGFEVGENAKKRLELLEKEYVPAYMKDLVLKITDRIMNKFKSKNIDNINEIINGDFYYDPKERDFVFVKSGESFKNLSIASGVKYLGLVSMLLKTGFINEKSLIILDEPETNVHPKWQIRFAELIVKLVKEGNYFLISSHSPYFIEALKRYSDKFLHKKNVSFYITERNSNRNISYINNVTEDISPIFEILAQPYKEMELFGLKEIS